MPQRRGRKPPKQDHSVYVQQLFQDFLSRNNGRLAAAPQCDTRTNFFQPEPVNVPEQRKKPGIFDRAVYARFERDNNGGFMRQEPTIGAKTGLMRWIDHQRNQRMPQNQVHKSLRTDDYLNLPAPPIVGAFPAVGVGTPPFAIESPLLEGKPSPPPADIGDCAAIDAVAAERPTDD
uniref:Uncharacterized protein n=1 Tax=Anopheles farauti TaxID=69004 RepID=A0A182PZP3_9DIPT